MTDVKVDRQVRHRLALMRHTEEASGNVAMTCRYFGITRHTEYRGGRDASTSSDGRADGPLEATKSPVQGQTDNRPTVVAFAHEGLLHGWDMSTPDIYSGDPRERVPLLHRMKSESIWDSLTPPTPDASHQMSNKMDHTRT
jgi:hypothetical protein